MVGRSLGAPLGAGGYRMRGYKETGRSTNARLKIPKGKTFLALSSIPLLGDKACATEICEFISKRTGQETLAAEVYVMLGRLKSQNLIAADDESPDAAAQRGTRRRRIYSLTEEGRLAVEAGQRLYDVKTKDVVIWDQPTIVHHGGQSV